MTEVEPSLPSEELARLEELVARALESGDVSELEVLGYGEVSCVIATRSGGQDLACKRLPSFRDASDWEAYSVCFAEYLSTLSEHGVRPLASALRSLERADGARTAWCVQPRLPGQNLLSKHFHDCSEQEAGRLFELVLDAIVGCVGDTVGLDGQLSNWVIQSGELRYLDVTTPLLRTAQGEERLPINVFLASLPWALRPFVRRFMLQSILDKYYDPRGVVLDLLGNLFKERLTTLLPQFAERASERVSPRITPAEAERYYRGDARDWALLQRLRHADRWWQTRVRGRPYPFLLPGAIER